MYNIKELRNNFESYLAAKLEKLDIKPTLNIIQVGDNFASNKYIHYKTKKAEALKIPINLIHFDTVTFEKIKETIDNLASEKNSGIIVQLPIEPNLVKVIRSIPPNLDVDLLNHREDLDILPPTILAIDLVIKKILQKDFENFESFINNKLDYSKHKVAVIGQGQLVGLPLNEYLKDRKAQVVIIDENTTSPAKLCKQCDIVISAVGKPNLVDNSWINSNNKTIIIDAATSENKGNLVGDINISSLENQSLLVAPPKGIGSLTILSLFYNLIKLNS